MTYGKRHFCLFVILFVLIMFGKEQLYMHYQKTKKVYVIRYGGEYFFFLSLLITFRSAKVLMYLVKLLVSQLVGPPSVSIGLMELVILFSFSIFLSFFIGRLWFSVVLI